MFKNISSKILIYKCEKTGKRIALEPNKTSEFGNDYLIRRNLLCDIGSGVCENVDASADLKKQVSTLKSELTKADKKIEKLEAKIAELESDANAASDALGDLADELTKEEVSNG